MVAASGCLDSSASAAPREDLVVTPVPLRAPLDDQPCGQIETRPGDEKAQRGVDQGRAERAGERGVECLDVLEIREMGKMLAQHFGVQCFLE